MQLWSEFIYNTTQLYKLNDIRAFKLNISWLKNRLIFYYIDDLKKLYMCVLEIMKNYDIKKIKHNKILFKKLKKAFYNYKFISLILKTNKLSNNQVINYNNFITDMLEYYLNFVTLSIFKYNEFFDRLPEKGKLMINNFYDISLDKTMKIDIPFNYFEYNISKPLNNKFSKILINYLKYLYPSEMILERRIKWNVQEDKYKLKVVNLDNETISRDVLSYLIDKIRECDNSSSRFLIISLSLKFNGNKNSKHRNMLIYDKYYKTLERFEPWGSITSSKFQIHLIDKLLSSLLKKYNIKYISLLKQAPVYGVQKIQASNPEEKKHSLKGEPGRCIAWSVWYVDVKMNNKNNNQLEILNKVMFTIKNMKNEMYTNYIRNYVCRISVFDNILKFFHEDLNIINLQNIKNKLIKLNDFINIYGIFLLLMIPFTYISFVNDDDFIVYINGKSLKIIGIEEYFNGGSLKLYLNQITNMVFTYGTDVIYFNDLINMLNCGYCINFIYMEVLYDFIERSQNNFKFLYKINKVLKKHNLNLLTHLN
jgi:hypothetical protein